MRFHRFSLFQTLAVAVACLAPIAMRSGSASEDPPVEIVIENEPDGGAWIDARFLHRAVSADDPAFAWSPEHDPHPPLAARTALRLATATMDELWDEERRHGTDYRIHFDGLSLRPLADGAWVWIARYRIGSFNGTPIQGPPMEIEIPVLMTGRVPDPQRDPDAPLRAHRPFVPRPDSRRPSRFLLAETRERTNDKRLETEFRLTFPGLYEPYMIQTARITFDVLSRAPKWESIEPNPPLPPSSALEIANNRLPIIRWMIGAPETDVRFRQLTLVRHLSRWYWLAEFHLDNHDEDDFNFLQIPIFFDGNSPAMEYEDGRFPRMKIRIRR